MSRVRFGSVLWLCSAWVAACGLSLDADGVGPGTEDASTSPPPTPSTDGATPEPPGQDATADREPPPDTEVPDAAEMPDADAGPACLARSEVAAQTGAQLQALCEAGRLTCVEGGYQDGTYYTSGCGDAGACIGWVAASVPNHFEVSTTYRRTLPGYDAWVFRYAQPQSDAAAPDDADPCAVYAAQQYETVVAVYQNTGWKLHVLSDLESCQRFYAEVSYGNPAGTGSVTLRAERRGDTLRVELLGANAEPVEVESSRAGDVVARWQSGTSARGSEVSAISFVGCALEQ